MEDIEETLENKGKVVRLLETDAKKVGQQINANKTKLMELINSGENLVESKGLIFEKLDDSKYLGATLSPYRNWTREIDIWLNKAEKTF